MMDYNMSRRSTVSVIILAIMMGCALFHVKYQVVDIEERLKKIHHTVAQEKATIRLLEAEWAYLNEPRRLQELSEKYLALAPTRSNQLMARHTLNQAAKVTMVRAYERGGQGSHHLIETSGTAE
jgi:hypothetical protein